MFSKRIIVIFSFLVIFCFLFSFATPTAQALTLKQKQTLISNLQKQIAVLQERLKTLYTELEKATAMTAALITVLPGSSLNLSLVADNPKTHNVAKGSTGVVFLKANFSSGNTEDIRINSIRVYVYKNSGEILAEKNDIKNLKIFEGKNQIGVTQTDINDGLAIFAGLNWQIPAATTKILTLAADVPIETDNDNLQIVIQGGNNLNVSGIKTGKSILAQGLAEGSFLKIVPSGALSVSLPDNSSTTSNIQKGKTYLDFLKINLSASDAEAIAVKSITLKRDGCSDLDFSKLRIYDVGTRLSADTSFVNGEATFDLSAVTDWFVPSAQLKTLTVKADLSTLDSVSCQVRFCLATTTDNNYQISAQGKASGTKINVKGPLPFCGSYSNLIGLTPSITLLSPNGGEKLIKGKTYDIAWSSISLGTPGIKINISLWKVNPDNTFSLNQTIASDVDPLAAKYSWEVPKNLAVGKYKIVLFTVGFAKSDESDSYFYIVN